MADLKTYDGEVAAVVDATIKTVTALPDAVVSRAVSDSRRDQPIPEPGYLYQIRHGQQGEDEASNSATPYVLIATELEVFYHLASVENERDYTLGDMADIQAVLTLERTWRGLDSVRAIVSSPATTTSQPETDTDRVVGFTVTWAAQLTA